MSTVLAYLDAGSGSMILQAILGGAAGVFVAIKMFGVRVKNAIFFWRKDEDQTDQTEPAPQPPTTPEPSSEPQVKTPV